MPAERQYELVYIIVPTATDSEVEALQGEFDGLIQKLGGSVETTEVWGRRKLAYEIGHFNEGIYIVQLLNGPAEMVTELDRRLRVRDEVIRHLTVRVDEDLRKARRVAERRKAVTARRRAAKGTPTAAADDDSGAEATADASAETPDATPAAKTETSAAERDQPAADTPAAAAEPAADSDTPAADGESTAEPSGEAESAEVKDEG